MKTDIPLDDYAWVTYESHFLFREEADALLAWALTEIPWETEVMTMYGKRVELRRKSCAFGTGTYCYSGVTKVARSWPKELEAMLYRLRKEVDPRINFGLANLYADGTVALGAHADDEREIRIDSPIVGVSLGAERDFVLTGPAGCRKVLLEHGSAITMLGDTQSRYKHAVPARKGIKAPRVSITFRCNIA